MKWELLRHRIIGACHVSTLSEGDALPLRAYIQDNGEGFNWCVSPSLDDFMMEHPHRLSGGAASLTEAQLAVEEAVRGYLCKLNSGVLGA